MEELTIIDGLSKFANGNTLILLYLAVQFVRMLLTPIYRSGKDIKRFIHSATNALDEGVFSHSEIVAELKILNKHLKKD